MFAGGLKTKKESLGAALSLHAATEGTLLDGRTELVQLLPAHPSRGKITQ